MPADSFHIEGLEFYDKLSFLKGGIVYASHLTTVSETYAREITTTELGCGLEGLLRRRSDAEQLTGILNGIDESWDPRVCAQLAQPFGAGDWQGKRANADYVRQQFGLALSRGPIFGLVARLVHQKGVDLVLAAADEIVEAGGQIVVTGSGEPQIEQALVDAHRRRPDVIGVAIGFNDGQARRDFCRQRFYPDALALRAVRVEPDVCPEIRIAADRTSNRGSCRNHSGWRNRISVQAAFGRIPARRHPARVHDLCEARSSRRDAPQCHVALVQLATFRRPAMARSIERRCRREADWTALTPPPAAFPASPARSWQDPARRSPPAR